MAIDPSNTIAAGADAFASGSVALVGAGPGDPDLLTLKALKRLSAAEIVFVDRLVGSGVMALINPAAEIVSVGKSKGEHSVPQTEINARLVAAARASKRVVRLKGGDPFIFGRGGEEMEALREAGVPVEIVPGVSSALGCAASAQIPLTHRDLAQSVTFVTGHAALGAEPDLDWEALARGNQTVVVFMGLGAADRISTRLVAAGRAADTPVAVIENGTRPGEVLAHGRLGVLSEIIAEAGVTGPAIVIIGEVAALGRDAMADRTADAHGATVASRPRSGDRFSGKKPGQPGASTARGKPGGRPVQSANRPRLADIWSLLP